MIFKGQMPRALQILMSIYKNYKLKLSIHKLIRHWQMLIRQKLRLHLFKNR